MTELTLEQSLKQILPTLPLPIQKFFEQRKLGETAHILMERYALHVDQGAILERELMLLLLGLENPEQFAEALYAELPISKQTVQDIIADVNAQIFVPLREEMRKGPNVEVKPPQVRSVAAHEAPREGVLQPRTTIIPANPSLPPHAPQILAPSLKFTAPVAALPRKSPVAPVNSINKIQPTHPAAPVQPQASHSSNQAPIGPSRLLEDHEEPHIEFKKAPSPTPESPLRQALRTVMPPPSNLPGVIQHPPLPRPPVVPTPTQPPQPRLIPPTAPTKPYSSDPYREPIEP